MNYSMPDGVSSSGQSKNRATDLNWNPIGEGASEHQRTHGKSDVDSGHDSMHHTLGRGAFQAMPGSMIETLAPVGQTFMWFADTPPKGFIILNGQELSRTDYAELWNYAVDNNLVGTPGGITGGAAAKPFGYGNGSTTFTVPDLVYRVPIGVAANAGASEGLERSGGSKAPRWQALKQTHSHDIYLDSFPSTDTSFAGAHNHGGSTGNGGDHNHTGTTGSDGGHSHGVSVGGPSDIVDKTTGGGSAASGSHTHSGSTDGAGNHTHIIGYSGNHDHSISNQTDHIHAVTWPSGTTVKSETSYLNEYQRTGLDPAHATIGMGDDKPFIPHLLVIWVMRYTNLLGFEGSAQVSDVRP